MFIYNEVHQWHAKPNIGPEDLCYKVKKYYINGKSFAMTATELCFR